MKMRSVNKIRVIIFSIAICCFLFNLAYADFMQNLQVLPGPVVTSDECSSIAISPLEITTLYGYCRGYNQPEHLRYCLPPNGVMDIQLLLTNTHHTTQIKNVKVELLDVSAYLHNQTSPFTKMVLTAVSTEMLNGDPDSGPAAPSAASMESLDTIAPQYTTTYRALFKAPLNIVGIYDFEVKITPQPCPTTPATEETEESQDGLNDNSLPEFTLEITCNDGIFCNGKEEWIDGECLRSDKETCDDEDSCTTDKCDEAFGTCSHTLLPTPECASFNCTGPMCASKCPPYAVCGGNGCGGFCAVEGHLGICPPHYTCFQYQCVPSQHPYSCDNPAILFPVEALLNLPYTQQVILDPTQVIAGDEIQPTCVKQGLGTQPDYIYAFVLPPREDNKKWGIDIRLNGKYNSELDTILEIRKDRCRDIVPYADALAANDYGCNDNSVAPGELGSRILALLEPATYYLAVTTQLVFNPVNISDGRQYVIFFPDLPITNVTANLMELNIRIVDNYLPICENKACGDDGYGGECAVCPDDSYCTPEYECRKRNCKPNCVDKVCGSDGCGGQCGDCGTGTMCAPELGKCMLVNSCDGLRPECSPGCKDTEFCANDCQCHQIDDNMPDLIVKMASLTAEVSIATLNFTTQSCSQVEKCINGVGPRRLLRFSVSVLNQGDADVKLPDPKLHPDQFFFSPCHHHYHYNHFADYALIANGTVKMRGHKQAFCLEDTQQEQVGGGVKCLPHYNCTNPGIQRGWSDYYGADLDCQWIDITELPAGEYLLRVEVNANRQILESHFENNVVIVKVNITAPVTPTPT